MSTESAKITHLINGFVLVGSLLLPQFTVEEMNGILHRNGQDLDECLSIRPFDRFYLHDLWYPNRFWPTSDFV